MSAMRPTDTIASDTCHALAALPRRRLLMTTLACAGWGMAAAGHAAEDKFPSRPLRFVVPIPVGGGADLDARVFAQKITELSGQPVIVENKPGGNGIIAVQYVLGSAPDGYTILFGSNSSLSTNAATFRSLPYDPVKDLSPISLIAKGPCFIVVPAESPFHTLDDLIQAARKRPGALNYASGTVSYQLYTEWLNAMARIKTTPINYKGSGEILGVVMAGTVDYAMVDETASYKLVQAGKLRALAYTDAKRSANAPDVPSVAELGFPDLLAMNWVAAAVSAKVPQATVDRLAALFIKAGNSPEIQNFFTRHGGVQIMSTPSEMRQYQVDEIRRWKSLVAVTGMELQ